MVMPAESIRGFCSGVRAVAAAALPALSMAGELAGG